MSTNQKEFADREIEEIIKIGEKTGWIKTENGRKYIDRKNKKIKDFEISTLWGSDSFSIKINEKNHLVFTTDQHIEKTHFETRYMDLDEIGERALRCALSDIFATGAEPLMAFINISAKSTKTIEKIGDGIIRCAREFSLKLCGGDIGKSEKISISSFIVGLSEQKPFSRFGAKPGDHIFITGTVGDSALAFHIIKKNGRKFAEKYIPNALEKFLRPPIKKIPQNLKNIIRFTSDVSDGPLITCKWIAILNSISLEFFPERMPLSEEFIRFSPVVFQDPASISINWGEDYGIIFGIPEDKLKSENDFKKIERYSEVIGICLSQGDCIRALKKGYPYIKTKDIEQKEIFIFFTPFIPVKTNIGFRHF